MDPSQRLPPLVNALLDAALYPDLAEGTIECVQTHGAWVLLAGEFAYKIKKPVHLPFMDFSTLEKRHQDCIREVEINRRFAVDQGMGTSMYLGVVPIMGTPEVPAWGEMNTCPADAIEYAVKMRRFDGQLQLDEVCQRGELSSEHLAQLARDLARIQDKATIAPADTAWGKPEEVLRWAMDNFATLAEDLPAKEHAGHQALAQLRTWTEEQMTLVGDLLQRRRTHGHVREGHGDLHLGNLVLVDDSVMPFDAIEFNDALRWIDVASEVAFLWMDLLARKHAGLAHVWLSEWMDASGDVEAPVAMPFFAVYRALVRAKVAAIEYRQQEGAGPAPQEVSSALARCKQYIRLAQRLARPDQPALVITHGLSGSGKSTEALSWMQSAGAETQRCLRLRSDVERKRLHGLGPLAQSGSGMQSGLYAPAAHEATYSSLLDRSRTLLQSGWTVVVDAAFLKRAERSSFRALASELSVPFGVLAPDVPVEALRRRIEQRARTGGDASEATVAVLEQQLGWIEALDQQEQQSVIDAHQWPLD